LCYLVFVFLLLSFFGEEKKTNVSYENALLVTTVDSHFKVQLDIFTSLSIYFLDQ